MEPGRSIPDVEPWAWWDFSTTGTYDRARRFNAVRLSGDARIEAGCLVLSGDEAGMLASQHDSDGSPTANTPQRWTRDDPVPAAALQSARLLREKLMADKRRPRYHFCIPEDNGRPGDANGCFFAGGRYHLMYLYNRSGVGFCWGHMSSKDLVHWRHHPDAIGPGDGDEGCFSGGAFVDDDGTAYLSYWMLWGAKGIGLAKSLDPDYEHWEKLDANPVIRSTEWGITETTDANGAKLVYGSADPTNVWKKGGKYYILAGNLLVLNNYGRKTGAPEHFKGDHLYLLESDDLANWSYKGEFYDRRDEWTDASEDNMCPSFLPLPASPDGSRQSDKHLLLFISHNKGCQYYIGDYDEDGDRFHPTAHGRMTWVDNTYFAPEALIDDRGRQIMWAWLTDNPGGEGPAGWSGVYGLPRSLWLGPDGTLRMRPVAELATLRTNERSWRDLTLKDGETHEVGGVSGESCEVEIMIAGTENATWSRTATRCGVKVRATEDGAEETLIYYDAATEELCFDARRSGTDGRRRLERAPLRLADGEPLRLRVFVDRTVVEVYANDRQAICRRVYPSRDDANRVILFAAGGKATFRSVRAWEMAPSNPW